MLIMAIMNDDEVQCIVELDGLSTEEITEAIDAEMGKGYSTKVYSE